jgi:O-antigen/teichoic acid export membrane protein
MPITIFGKKISAANFSVGVTGATQFVNAILGFATVPLLIHYFSTDDYGIWVTLLSLITWIGIFDFGIGYSFKNKVTESLVDKNAASINALFKQCMQYYLIITTLLLILFFVLLKVNPILSQHKLLSILIYVPAILVFPLGLSGQILQGLRLAHIASIYGMAKSASWTLSVGILVFLEQKSTVLGCAMLYSTLHVGMSVFVFYLALKKSALRMPTIQELRMPLVFDKTIITGLQFFALQISGLFFFSMGNYYIYSNLSAKDTMDYDLINKIFTFFFSFFNTTIGVYWAEIAYYKASSDYLKLKQIYRNLLLFSGLFSIGAWILTLVAPPFIFFWTKGKVNITTINCIPFAFLITVQAFTYNGAVFMNAFEKVKLQIVLAAISIVFLYPLLQYGFEHDYKIATPPLVSAILVLPALIGCNIMAVKLIASVKQA